MLWIIFLADTLSPSWVEKAVVPLWAGAILMDGGVEYSYHCYQTAEEPGKAVFWRNMTRGFEYARDVLIISATTITIMYFIEKWRKRHGKKNRTFSAPSSLLFKKRVQQSL
ncbi:hypothetical protein DRQ20_06355 [bacterium]|nr:MAG: hypothetical protein DRQ20_06355 [bacterium]